MSTPKILHLTLKKKWFDMIASGEKKEEYREIKKHWAKRFASHIDAIPDPSRPFHYNYSVAWIHFDVVRFRNGYATDAPTMDVKCEGIKTGEGKTEWGAQPGAEYFIISLGDILSISNQ